MIVCVSLRPFLSQSSVCEILGMKEFHTVCFQHFCGAVLNIIQPVWPILFTCNN